VWTEITSGVAGELQDVWGTSANNVYAVGMGGLVLSNIGGSWAPMSTPNPEDLYGIHGNGTHTFAVGTNVFLYYDGTAWQEGFAYAFPPYTFREVWGGSTSVFAVGAMDGDIHFKDVTKPDSYWGTIFDASSAGESMYGIWAVTDNDIYVVGEKGLVLHCAANCASLGSTWTQMVTGESTDLHGTTMAAAGRRSPPTP
jgi:hypothetical protein